MLVHVPGSRPETVVGFVEAPGHDDGSSEHEGGENGGALGDHGTDDVHGRKLKHADNVDESNNSEKFSYSHVKLAQAELHKKSLNGVKKEPRESQSGVDIEGAVFASHTNRCIIEPSILFAMDIYTLKGVRGSNDVAVEKRSRECKEAD